MGKNGLRLLTPTDQLAAVDRSVNDVRSAHPTGFDGIDALLRRGGLLPGNFVLLAGRTGTRKTTIALNMMVHLVNRGTPVGLVGLDESSPSYMTKLLSVFTGRSVERIEAEWNEDRGRETREAYREAAQGLVHLYEGRRPGPEHLDAVLSLSSLEGEEATPQVIFIDYLSLLSRSGEFSYGENSRIPRLAEEMQVWSTEKGITLVVLHQLGRNDEYGGTNSRNAGHIPVTLQQLMYGGEQAADVVLGTYRPALNPIANMAMDIAREVLGDRFDEEDYWRAKKTAEKYGRSTLLQVLKNRPGTTTELRGVELLSPTESLRMEEKEAEEHESEERSETSYRR